MKSRNILITAVFLGLLEFLNYCQIDTEVSFGNIISQMAFGHVGLGPAYIPDFLYAMIPIVVFQISYGSYLYRHFCTASVYYFSRCTRRTAWFLQESAKLYFHTFFYQLLYWFFGGFLTVFLNSVQVDLYGIVLFIITFILYTLWLFTTTLAVNIFAVKTNLVTGFGIIFGLELLCIIAYSPMRSLFLPDLPEIPYNSELLFHLWKWNPISQLVIKWHSSISNGINSMINSFQVSFDLLWSAAYLVFFCILTVIAGIFVISKTELLGNDMEEY